MNQRIPPYLQNIKFSTNKLNSSQKEAIKKALYSDSISLIQGPPGTGKTTVIKEIIQQILMQIDKLDDTSRIRIPIPYCCRQYYRRFNRNE